MAFVLTEAQAKEAFANGKVPYVIHSIPTFDGSTNVLEWVTTVEKELAIFVNLPAASLELHTLNSSIRRKIIGDAADTIISENAGEAWSRIKDVLIQRYSDQRCLQATRQELTSVKLIGNDYYSLYSQLRGILVRISQIINSTNDTPTKKAIQMEIYEQLAIDSFVSKLPQYLIERIVILSQDKQLSLLQYLQLTNQQQELYNLYQKGNNQNNFAKKPPMPLPVQKPNQFQFRPTIHNTPFQSKPFQFQQNPFQQNPFQLKPFSNPFQGQQNQFQPKFNPSPFQNQKFNNFQPRNQFQPQVPRFAQKPPTPMSVDGTEYQNTNKRGPERNTGVSNQVPIKRFANPVVNQEPEFENQEEYEEYCRQYEEYYSQLEQNEEEEMINEEKEEVPMEEANISFLGISQTNYTTSK